MGRLYVWGVDKCNSVSCVISPYICDDSIGSQATLFPRVLEIKAIVDDEAVGSPQSLGHT